MSDAQQNSSSPAKEHETEKPIKIESGTDESTNYQEQQANYQVNVVVSEVNSQNDEQSDDKQNQDDKPNVCDIKPKQQSPVIVEVTDNVDEIESSTKEGQNATIYGYESGIYGGDDVLGELNYALDNMVRVNTTATEGPKDVKTKSKDRSVSIGGVSVAETQEVSSSRNEPSSNRSSKGQRSSRRPSYPSGRVYGTGIQNYGLSHLPYKSNFEPSEQARRRADEFVKSLKL